MPEPTYDEILAARPDPDRDPRRRRQKARPPTNVDGATGEVHAPPPVAEQTPRGRALPEIPSLGEIEQRILSIDDELHDLTLTLYDAEDDAANSEADWKEHRDIVIMEIADAGDKGAKDTREAAAKTRRNKEGLLGRDLHRAYLLHAGRARSIAKHLDTLKTRMSGLQTIARGIRSSTDQYGPRTL